MVMVPAGSAVIGAPANSADASAAEQPQTEVRFWPGYMISVAPVSSASFAEYAAENSVRRAACGIQTAALGDDAPVGGSAASCVLPSDADGYAAWLSARTGKPFRVPTAAEWEYAARTLAPAQLTLSDGPEIVADCWHAQIPPQGRERIAARTAPVDCGGRMAMGEDDKDGAAATKLSTRHRISAEGARADLGFRVMRPLVRGQ